MESVCASELWKPGASLDVAISYRQVAPHLKEAAHNSVGPVTILTNRDASRKPSRNTWLALHNNLLTSKNNSSGMGVVIPLGLRDERRLEYLLDHEDTDNRVHLLAVLL